MQSSSEPPTESDSRALDERDASRGGPTRRTGGARRVPLAGRRLISDAGADAAGAPASTLQTVLRADGLWLGLTGLLLAYLGQRTLTPDGWPDGSADIAAATRFYLLGTLVFVIGWSYGYANRSLLCLPDTRFQALRTGLHLQATRLRLGLAFAAVLTNLLALTILWRDWFSTFGGWLWPVSLLLLLLAGAKPLSIKSFGRSMWLQGGAYCQSRRNVIELSLLTLCLVLALVMRAWRLGDLQPGMHGDEGEAGSTALQILQGIPISPFGRGWFQHSNIYFWTVALFMRIFGTGLIGLRSFAVFCGLITTLFVYLLTREMFGRRAALLAGFFMAFQSADVLLSRQLSSNTATPTLTVVAYYFLIRGLRTRRYLDWIVAGFAAGFGVYYFAGGRLVAPVAVVFLVYLMVMHRRFLLGYWSHLVAFGVALLLIVSPYLAYLLAYPIRSTDYPNDRFIWLHHDDLAAIYGSGDWLRILWGQLTATLSIFTYRHDVSANTILDYPAARPLEAVLIVLGVTWALWRWRDTRFALLSMWFWASIVAGGVLTTEAPNLPRIIGLLPMLPILIAAVLDRFAEQAIEVAGKLGKSIRWRQGGAMAGGGFAVAILVIAGVQNWHMYIDGYLNRHPNTVVTGQAIFVQHYGLGYRYYDMGNPLIYWGHGDNRFINRNADGIDVINPANFFPVIDNGPSGEKNVIFMVWQPMHDYLDVLRAYYPEGHVELFPLGDPNYQTDPIAGYIITHQQIDRHRILRFRFAPVRGPVTSRTVHTLGRPVRGLPDGTHPGTATWDGGLVAPAYDTYTFRMRGPRGSHLVLDGVTVLRMTGGIGTGHVTLAQGPHVVHLSVPGLTSRTPLSLQWGSSTLPLTDIDPRFLWDNHIGRAWLGVSRPLGRSASSPFSRQQRIDGFLGFRSTNISFAQSGSTQGVWRSILHVTRPGPYGFELNSLGDSSLRIDGRAVIVDRAPGPGPHDQPGMLNLSPGDHTITVGYRYDTGVGFLECWWTPPGGIRRFLVTSALRPSGSATHVARAGIPIPPLPTTLPPIPEPPAAPHGR